MTKFASSVFDCAVALCTIQNESLVISNFTWADLLRHFHIGNKLQRGKKIGKIETLITSIAPLDR
jgi:hypothetical protein